MLSKTTKGKTEKRVVMEAFKHFDADQSGYLSREQAEAALAFLSQGKPVAIAIPVHVDGTVRVGAPWFWDMFKLLVQ